MKTLTIKERNKLCLSLWRWLAKTGEVKSQWPEFKNIGYVLNGCFLCEYGDQKRNNTGICSFCPLIINNFNGCSANKYNYNKWQQSSTNQQRKFHAKKFYNQLKYKLRKEKK